MIMLLNENYLDEKLINKLLYDISMRFNYYYNIFLKSSNNKMNTPEGFLFYNKNEPMVIFNINKFLDNGGYEEFKTKYTKFLPFKNNITIFIINDQNYDGLYDKEDDTIYVDDNEDFVKNIRHEIRHIIDYNFKNFINSRVNYDNLESEIRAKLSELDFNELKNISSREELKEYIIKNRLRGLSKKNYKKYVKIVYLMWLNNK